MSTFWFYIPGFQNDSGYPKQTKSFEILLGKIEIIHFILLDRYIDSPEQGMRQYLTKSV